jgi:hypothetical protein
VKTIDPNMKLDGFTLQQALESIYCTFAAVLLGRGATDCPDLYLNDIPGMVFDVAVGAGWLPLAEGHFDPKLGTAKGDVVWEADWYPSPKTVKAQWVLDRIEALKKEGWQPPAPTKFTKNQAQRLVQLGDCIVDRAYADSFYALLNDTIAFHLGEGTKHEENLKRLPKSTSKKERETVLQKYVSKEEAAGTPVAMKEIARRAAVDYSVLVKWKNKQKPMVDDSVDPAQRIMCLLLCDEIGSARRYHRAVTT